MLVESPVRVPLRRPKSQKLYEQACQVIPAGVNSPVRSFPGLNQTPLVIESGKGERIYDADGHSYLDYCGSWGALIHGHAPQAVVEAVQKRVALGSSFGISCPIEAELAHLVTQLMPHIEKIRFVSSGTEATMSAVRLARGFTGRDLIVKFTGNYHGHADAFLVQAGSGVTNLSPTSSSKGVPADFVKHTLCLPYNDLPTCQKILRQRGKEIAAVILEPIAGNMGVVKPSDAFIQMLREETEKGGALLIFDEAITGFRVALGGAASLFGVTPDLTTLGKIVGGGFPAAAFGGRKEIMDFLAPTGPVYQAGTLSGNPVAMEAGYQHLLLCRAPHFYEKLEAKTRLLTDPIEEAIQKRNLNLCLHRVGSMFTLFFGKRKIERFEEVKECEGKAFTQFFQTLFQQGIYIAPFQFEANFVSAAHTEESLLYTRDCILEALLA